MDVEESGAAAIVAAQIVLWLSTRTKEIGMDYPKVVEAMLRRIAEAEAEIEAARKAEAAAAKRATAMGKLLAAIRRERSQR